jgi:hypothetical protein
MPSVTAHIASADHEDIVITIGSRGHITATIPASVVEMARAGGIPTMMTATTEISDAAADEWGSTHEDVALAAAFVAGMMAATGKEA